MACLSAYGLGGAAEWDLSGLYDVLFELEELHITGIERLL
jgi:hypothetical protein